VALHGSKVIQTCDRGDILFVKCCVWFLDVRGCPRFETAARFFETEFCLWRLRENMQRPSVPRW